jgi:hypothetical protein
MVGGTLQLQDVPRLAGSNGAGLLAAAAAREPLVMTDDMAGWNALEQWTPQYLRERCGKAMVPVIPAGEYAPVGRFFLGSQRTELLPLEQCVGLLEGEPPAKYMAGVSMSRYLRPLLGDICPPCGAGESLANAGQSCSG